jgi:L-serine dehydratase
MAISVLELFKIGIGPSSSHTVGPMRAARLFAVDLEASGHLGKAHAVKAELFGSLGATGRGHGSDKAVILGLLGETPEGVDVAGIAALVAAVRRDGRLALLGRHGWRSAAEHLVMHRTSAPFHPTCASRPWTPRAPLASRVYSVGRGFVVDGRPRPAETDQEDARALASVPRTRSGCSRIAGAPAA